MTIKRVAIDAMGRVIAKASPKAPSPKVLGYDKVIKVNHLPAPRTNRATLGRNGHWIFDKPMCNDGQFGFIYLIHDTLNNRFYIGKKQYHGTGVENAGKESNWKWYRGSCTQLKNLIRINKSDAFKFYVLEEYYIRGTLGYAESWSLMHVEAPANKGLWYNTLINEVSWVVKETITKKHRERLSAIVQGRFEDLAYWSENENID